MLKIYSQIKKAAKARLSQIRLSYHFQTALVASFWIGLMVAAMIYSLKHPMPQDRSLFMPSTGSAKFF